jgi:hypothetical protein
VTAFELASMSAGAARRHPDVRWTRSWEVVAMLQSLPMSTNLTRTLCIVVFVVMFAALIYAAWIGVGNYSRIHV